MGFSKLQYLKGLHGEKMDHSTFRVMVTMFNHTDKDGHNGYPSRATLAEECNMSVSTVKRKLKELVEMGWLVKVSNGGRSGDGSHWSTKYSLGYRFVGESQGAAHDLDAGQTGGFGGSSQPASAGHSDDVNGSDCWAR